MTARRALSDLVHEGKVVRVRGKGSFVLEGPSSPGPKPRPATAGKGIVPLILLSYDHSDSSIISIIGGAQTYLSGMGYSMTIECGNSDVATEVEILDRCIRDRVVGVLLFSTDPEAAAEKLAEMAREGIPYVMLDRSTDDFPCTAVASYNFDCAYQITRHLIENGHRRIMYMASDRPTSVHAERLQGYSAAMRRHGGELIEELCLTSERPDFDLMAERIRAHGATAVVSINDRLALAVMEALAQRGLRVPEDISVTGFDDSETGRWANLTTVRQPFREIGRLSAVKLLELTGGKTGHSRTFLPVEIVVRGSTGPAREGGKARS
jgi:DNA-binding LacI/PurR family transcriptional regulator